MRPRAVIAMLTLAAAVPVAHAQPALESSTPNTVRLAKGSVRPSATLDAIAWLAGGMWRGEGLGGVVEESWSAPAAGAMMGMFRLVRKNADGRDEVGFYEFLTLVEENGSLALKLKHFNADLTGWEDKDGFVTFRLARVAPDRIDFDGLSFRRNGDNAMTIYLAIRDRSGQVREEVFHYTR